MNADDSPLEVGDVVVVTNSVEDDWRPPKILIRAGSHGVTVRTTGTGWVVRLDTGHEAAIDLTDLDLFHPAGANLPGLRPLLGRTRRTIDKVPT